MSAADKPLVSVAELMFIHTVMVDRFGGGIGIRDQGLVESALARPLAGFEGEVLYGTPFLRSAVVWHGLIKNHGFVDANKRTATMAMQRWLDREGYWLRAGDPELVETAVAIANDRHTVESLAAWIEERAEPIEPIA